MKLFFSISLLLFYFISFSQIFNQEVPWNVPNSNISGHSSHMLEFDHNSQKFKWTGGDWKTIKSMLYLSDGSIGFATGQFWNGAWPSGTFDGNNLLSVEDLANKFGRFFISNSGNVSIGVRQAQARMHVDGIFGGNRGLLLSQLNLNRGLSFQSNFWWNGEQNYISREGDFGIIFSDDFTGNTNMSAGFVIAPRRDGAQFMGLRMDALGNVGIGTPLTDNSFDGQPNYFKLSVRGSIRAEEIIVETGWADFVFESDYELMSLYEVEDFIAKNKHLPGVPSATEIQQNGLQVGSTQTIQMQKIEELTLYIIEQQKLIDQLIEQMNQLNADN
jgi:hypothetical protein